jgi:hypothetical protein
MCDKCNDKGYIYYGSDTFTGQEQIVCECKNTKIEDNKNVIFGNDSDKRNDKD